MKDLLKKWARPALAATLLGATLQNVSADEMKPPQEPSTQKTDPKSGEPVFEQGILFPYELLDQALNSRMDNNGNVDYLALRANPSLALFVRATNTADLGAFPVWKEKDKEGKVRLDRSSELVFWINAFNGHILKAVSDAYPVKNVGEIKGLFTDKTHVVAGKTYSLQEIRDKIVGMDARALFALSEGTKGGPLLSPSAYRLTGLSDALDGAVSAFVNDPRNVVLTRIQDQVQVSDYFREADKSFSSKFKRGKWGGIRYLLMTYTRESAQRKYFITNDFRVNFQAKDNSLNNKNL